MAARATAALGGAEQLLLTDVVFAECIYVLESFYEAERDQVAELMRSAIAFATLETVDSGLLLRALELYELDRLDFAEAYLVAQAEVTGVGGRHVVRPVDRSRRHRHTTRTVAADHALPLSGIAITRCCDGRERFPGNAPMRSLVTPA
jgi:predicted nucleic-acid-binding protein